MSKFQIVRVERLKTMAEVKRSALHTFREIPTDNAISELKEKNEIPNVNSAGNLYKAVFNRIKNLDNKDKQACRCLEFFISASPEQFAENGKLYDVESQKRYFDESLNFIKNKHGAENVVCSVIHRDEKTPHMVVYAVPVIHREARTRKRSVGVKGGKVGERQIIEVPVPAASELSAKAYYHCPAALSQLQTDFHVGVSKGFGLERGISRVVALKNKRPAIWYAQEQAKIDAKKAALDNRDAGLDMREVHLENGEGALKAGQEALEADKVKERNFRKKVMDGQAEVKVGLDQREAALVAEVAGLKERESVLDDLRDKFKAAFSLLPIEQKAAIVPALEKLGVAKPRVKKM